MRPARFAMVALLAGALVTAQAIATGPALSGVEGPALSDAQASGVEGKRVEVLFLGHTRATEATDPKAGGWYHDSDRFAPMLKAALAPYGFNFSYTTDAADLNAANLAKYDALLIYANHRAIARVPGEGAARFRGRWQGAAGTPLGFVLFPEFASLHRPAGRAVRAARDRRVHRGIRQSLAPGAGGAAAVPGLGRDLRSHETRSGSHRPDGAGRRRGPRAVDVGPHPRKRPRFLHRLWARRASVGPSELPRAHEERDDLGDWG